MSSNQAGNANQGDGANRSVPASEQPRQPRNLQGLLRFAMEATKNEDAPGNSQLGPMDEERRKFLEEALKSLTINVAETIQKAINVLSDTEKMHGIQLGQALPQDVENAFDTLLNFTDNIDIANDYYKMGGFSVFPVCYGSENEKVRAKASSILGELCQNNPYCQAKALECGLVNVLLSFIETEKGLPLVKSIYALSCTTREFEPACKELIAQGGCGALVNILQGVDDNAKTKAAFLIRYFAEHYPQAKAQFIEKNIVRIITEQIKNGRDNATEHLLNILVTLIDTKDPVVLSQCSDRNIGLRKLLTDILADPEFDGEVFIEEKGYCEHLLKSLKNCKVNDGSNPDGADR